MFKSKSINLENINKILIIHTAFLGDIALALPLVNALKSKKSSLEISFLTTPLGAQILKCSPLIDNIFIYDKKGIHKTGKGLDALISNINTRDVDCIISIHKSYRTSLIIKKIKKKLAIGFSASAMSYIYDFTVPYMVHKHTIWRNFELLKVFDEFKNEHEIIIDKNLVEFTEIQKSKVNNFINTHQINKYIIISPASEWATKMWGEDKYTNLTQKLINNGYTIILNGSSKEKELCDRIVSKTGAYSLAGELNLDESLYLVNGAGLSISNDSGPVHFAFLTNTRVLSIYGPTIPEFGFFPTGEFDKIVQTNELKCRPCDNHGLHICPLGHHNCMKLISVDKVFDVAMEIIEN